MKYIPHARRTNLQKSQGAKTKDTNKRVFSSSQYEIVLQCRISFLGLKF